MKTINIPQLRDLLAAVKGTTIVSFVAVTDARARKTGNPHCLLGPVFKVAKVNAVVGAEHEDAVNRQQTREGVVNPAFTEQQVRSWGERLSAALIKKGDDYYLPAQINPLSVIRPVYLAPRMCGTKVRLTPVATEAIAPFLPSERREERAAQQGVARLVDRKDYKLSSLAMIAIGGERYRVRT